MAVSIFDNFIGSKIWWKEEGCYASEDNGQEVRNILDDEILK